MQDAVRGAVRRCVPDLADSLCRCLRLAAFGVLLGVSGCGLFISDEQRMQRAEEAFSGARLRDAELELKALLENNPDHAAARLLLARVSLRRGDALAAEKEANRARELGSDPSQVQPVWYAALMAQQRFDEVLTSLDAGDPALSAPNALELRGTALLGASKFTEAEVVFRELESKGALTPAVGVGLARALIGQQKTADGIARLKQVLAFDEAHAPAWQTKGMAELSLGDYAAATASLEQALALHRKQADRTGQLGVLSALVETGLRANMLDAAKAHLATLTRLGPNLLVTALYTGLTAVQGGDAATAITSLEAVIAADPENNVALLALGQAKLMDGKLGQAEEYLRRAVNRDPTNVRARKLLASTQIRQAKTLAAIASLDPMLDDPDQQTSALVGQIRLMQGDFEAAIAAFERSRAAGSDDPTSALGLAASQLAAGDADGALETLAKVPDGATAAHGKEQLQVLAHAARKDLKAAHAEVDALVQREAGNADTLILAGALLANIGDAAAGADLIARALELAPDNVSALLAQARLQMARQDLPASRASLERVRALQPANTSALLGLAQVALLGGDIATGSGLLEEAINAEPQSAMPRITLARIRLARGDAAGAEKLVREAFATGDLPPAATNAIAEVLLGVGKPQEALAMFKDAHAASGLVEHGLNVAIAYFATNQIPAARAQLETLLEKHPDSIAARSLLARVNVIQGRPGDALRIADELLAAEGGSDEGALLKGDILLSQQRFADALREYEKVLARGGNTSVAIRAFEARRRGGLNDAEKPLVDWLAKNENDTEARLVVAEHFLVADRIEEAKAQYERLRQQTPDDPSVLNNLAWIAYTRGDADALGLATRAKELAPERPEIDDTLGRILLQANRADEALPLMRTAAEAIPGNGGVIYHYGLALARSGQRAEAAETLRKALALGNFKERDAAQALLLEVQ